MSIMYGQAIGPQYSWQGAVAGMISETVYWPLSAFAANWMIAAKRGRCLERQKTMTATDDVSRLRGVVGKLYHYC